MLDCADDLLLMQKKKCTDLYSIVKVVGRDKLVQWMYLSKDQECFVWLLDHADNELWKQSSTPMLETVAKIVFD